MPLLKPSASDFTATVKAVAQYVAPGAVATKPSRSGGGMVLALPSLGAVVRTSQIGALISPRTGAVFINGLIPPPPPPPFVYDWTGKLAQVSLYAGLSQIPRKLGVLPNGDLVTVEPNAHQITLVKPTGAFSVLAGAGIAGFADNNGANAQFNFPSGVAVLPDGNIVVVDELNHRIRLVTVPGGLVSTLAGQATPGSTDGVGLAAQFSYPTAIAVLPNGILAVGEYSTIRLVTLTGMVTTLPGSFSGIYGLAALPSGNLVVADAGAHCIYLVSPTGVQTLLAGNLYTSGTDDGVGTNARFNGPRGIAVLPNGNFVVADTQNSRIRLVTPTGVVTTIAGPLPGQTGTGITDGVGSVARFNKPQGVTVLPNGNIVVADTQNYRIRLLTPV